MAEYLIRGETLTNMADEIRTLSGTTGAMNPDEMTEYVADANAEITSQDALLDQAIAALEGKTIGGGAEPILQEKTAVPTTSAQEIVADSGYDGLYKVTVDAMPTATQATPSISVSSNGLITASASQSAGYVSTGTKSATKQLTTQAAKTITPSASSQTAVTSGVYTTGAITVAAIPSAYQDVTGVDAVAVDVVEGKKIVNSSGATVTGTNPYVKATTDTVVNSQATKLAQLKTILEGKAAGGGSGGSVETCTVYMQAFGCEGHYVFYNTLNSDGVITSATAIFSENGMMSEVTLSDVVCNSTIALNLVAADTLIEGTAEELYSLSGLTLIRAPEVAGEYCTIAF